MKRWRVEAYAGLTVVLHQNLLLAHVLHIHGAVDDELWAGAVVCHLLTLVALNLQSQPCEHTAGGTASVHCTG